MDISATALQREIEMLREHGATEAQKAEAAFHAGQTKVGREHRHRAEAYLMAAFRWAAVAAKLELLRQEREPPAPELIRSSGSF